MYSDLKKLDNVLRSLEILCTVVSKKLLLEIFITFIGLVVFSY